ncbi:MAG: hypothetical protein ABI847_03960 [Anaerolineales bacterium]
MPSRFSRPIRFTLMLTTILSIAALGVFGGRWATPAWADGTVGGGGGGGGGGDNGGGGTGDGGNGTGANGTGPAAAITSVPCGANQQQFSLSGAANITKLLKVGIGTVQLLSADGGVGTGAVKPVAAITALNINLVDTPLLARSPKGWTLLTCGMDASAKAAGGQAVTFIRKGQQVCFTLPVGATALHKTLRVAYYDKVLARWVFLKTTLSATTACQASFRLAPATFALFGNS